MRVLYKWGNCFRFNPRTEAFYLEIPKHEISESILKLLSKEKNKIIFDEKYFEEVNNFANRKLTKGYARENCIYVLIDKNVTKAILCRVYYPYSGQWGANCPFEHLYKSDVYYEEYPKNAIEINSVDDIKNIYDIIKPKGYVV